MCDVWVYMYVNDVSLYHVFVCVWLLLWVCVCVCVGGTEKM